MRNEFIKFSHNLPLKISMQSIKEYPHHWHDAYEIIFVLKGSINIDICTDKKTLQENSLEIVNTNEVHRIYSTDEENIVLFLQIDFEFCKNYCPNIIYTYLVCFTQNNDNQNEKKFDILRKYITKIVLEINEKSEDYEYRVRNILKLLFFHITDNFNLLKLVNSKLRNNEVLLDRYQRILEYTFHNYMNKISLQEIADMEHLSLYYLSKEIKNNLGYNFQEIVNLFRIEQSVRLLLSTDKKISEIYLECGFSDAKYFKKYFKKYFNYTPLQYRNKYKIENKRLQEIKNYKELNLSLTLEKLKPYLKKHPKDNKIEMLYINFSSKGKLYDPFLKNQIIVCNAQDILKANYQKHLREIQKDIGFKYIKILKLWDKEVIINHKARNEEAIYCWHYVDEILDFLSELNIKPIIVLNSVSLIQNKPNNIIKEFLSHCIEKYGLQKIEMWVFEASKDENIKFFSDVSLTINAFSSKIKVTHQNTSKFSRNFLFDTIFMAPNIIHNILHSKSQINFVQILDCINFNNKVRINNSIFNGGNGLITINGLKKASYYSYYLLSFLGNEIVEKGNGYVVTRKNKNIQILLYNYDDILNTNHNVYKTKEEKVNRHKIFNVNKGKEIIVNIRNLSGNYKVTRYELNEKHGSVFEQWILMGKPNALSEQEKKLLDRIVFPKVTFDYIKKNTRKNLSVKLAPYDVRLITFELIT